MKDELILNGEPVNLSPASVVRDDALWVPLEAFCQKIGAHIEYPEGEGRVVVCRGDLCVPLTVGEETVVIDNLTFAPLTAITEPLDLRYELAEEADLVYLTDRRQEVESKAPAAPIVGQKMPDLSLPDVFTGQLISLQDFLGKKTLIFAWASW